jgi:cysteine desulfurase
MKIENRIYLDHQATTPVDPQVLDAMLPYLTNRFGNPHSADHSFGWDASKAVENSASEVAGMIGSDPDEVIFVSGATEANNLALKGLADHPDRKKRNRILVSAIEHKSVLAAAREMRDRMGFLVTEIPVSETGEILLPVLADLLTDEVLLVSIGLVNGEIGTIQPIEEISALTRSHGALLHTDAAQAPLALDLKHLGQIVDMLSLSGHKMYGPQGIGTLYIERSLQQHIRPLIAGGGQQNNIRSGTIPLALCIGMGEAAKICASHPAENLRRQLRGVREQFVQALANFGCQFSLNGPSLETRHPGNLNIRFQGIDAHTLIASLQPHVAASMGSACTSGTPEPSHVLRKIGLTNDEASSSVRFSLGRNSSSECAIDAARYVSQAAFQTLNALKNREIEVQPPGQRRMAGGTN